MRLPVFFLTFLFSVAAVTAQRDQSEKRRTPLGTQTPRPQLPQRDRQPSEPTPSEPVHGALQRALNAHGGQNLRATTDSIAEGTFALYTIEGQRARYPLTLSRRGDGRVQRIIKYPNGDHRTGTNATQTWEVSGPFTTAARGPALEFIETQTVRALPNLFDHQGRGSRLRDDRMRGPDRALTVEEKNGRTTTYVIDGARGLITKMELVSGFAPDMLGRKLPIVESYVFSDYRPVQGIPTAFKIEHFTNNIEIDEMHFTSVRYNTGVKDDVFHP